MKRHLAAIVPVVIAWLVVTSVGYAHNVGGTVVYTHTTSGAGLDDSSTHSRNPAHLVVSVGADHGASDNITSGGRFHDNCMTTNQCQPAAGGDWAIDIGGGGGTPSHLYLNFMGYLTSGTVAVDFSKNIYVRAAMPASGQGRWGNDPACAWRKYDVSVECV